jgi:hypothetical protein
VANGTVCFFLVSSGGGGFGGNQANVNADLVSWVTSTCAVVPQSTYPSGGAEPGHLYDCAGAA